MRKETLKKLFEKALKKAQKKKEQHIKKMKSRYLYSN